MLSVAHISKTFGSVKALDDVSFDVHDGEIMGLIGQNGAGKSTTFHSILNFLQFDGQITFNGQPLSADDYNLIGYLPEERSLMPKLTIAQQITYLARLKNQPASVTKPKIAPWMAKFAVKGQPNDKINKLSKGNQQKVQLICTLIHDPQLIILDEPFSGLDPVNADLLKQAILDAKQRGATIIFSSHDMSNVEEICDSLVMLRDGQVVLNGTVDDVREQFGRTRLFLTTDWSLDELAALTGVQKVNPLGAHRYQLLLNDADAGPAIFAAVTQGEYIQEFSQQPPTLDEIFRTEAGGEHVE
ncbi:ABC transporter ATP-binding protein [Lactiplantibacillus fabifermentans]|uniref:ABC superfamily ATP binding cassette transporter, ABC protein n=2 Tax=Lactiplantibacillus fabifermentans TaxID=483011 RepID=A0A0R2NSI1_9LACO|nr:ABC transporter ATP-binding protein [Lactiplantibacillus fabifermentans]ETY73360.1 ABC transporter ATPase [Lactiplantibacillus fabifermentans T30PCM01]KRO28622.1 ABC superfamily ATP binding cassette transporter, ABC protein [Lactiplantibacillus fabifermentans DSM 21115]